jgi:hypothetical protein
MGKDVDGGMAMNSGEAAIVQTLDTAIALFKANLSYFIADIYGYESTANQQEIQTWWQNNASLVIREGYSGTPVEGLSWNVTIAPEQEIPGKKVIGSNVGMNGNVKTLMTSFDSTYIIGVLGINQNWVRWSQMLLKWALLYYRKSLENTYGLYNQKISMGALQPVPNDLRDAVRFAFMRTVSLSAQHSDTWDELPETDVTSINVNLNPVY